MNGVQNGHAFLKGMGQVGALLSPFQYFMMFFPMSYLKEVVLPTTNKKVSAAITLGAFGIWMLMATSEGSK